MQPNQLSTGRPVSYTHLDVYKRQILMRGQIPVQEAPAEAPEAPQAPRQVEVRQACLLYTSRCV